MLGVSGFCLHQKSRLQEFPKRFSSTPGLQSGRGGKGCRITGVVT